ncbi:MAG: fibrobacter succinogenes major paralogous domain-containing protein [Algicola sp.]|nr:fibrobacter succinogenes major paralogous domain-containing protein [Algicola sp.]
MKNINAGFKTKAVTTALALMLSTTSYAGEFIPAGDSDYLPLGTAYNSASKRFLNFQAVKGIREEEGISDSNVYAKQNMSYRETLSRLSGSVTVDIDMPVLQLDAGASLALESSSSAFTSSWSVSVLNTTPSHALGNEIGLTELSMSIAGQTIAAKNLTGSALLEAVGDSYIVEIEYGTQLFVSMTAQYRSQADKELVEGYINADLAAGLASVTAEGRAERQELKNSVKLTVKAHQYGGDPTGLLAIVPEGIITCTLQNPDPCTEMFGNAIRYAKGIGEYDGVGFEDKTLEISDANVLGYRVAKYSATAGFITAGLAEFSVDFTDNSAAIATLESEYISELQVQTRAQSLLSNYASDLSSTQRYALKEIISVTSDNAYALSELAEYCSTHYVETECADYIASNCPLGTQARTCLKTYNTAMFTLDFNDALANTMRIYSQQVIAGDYQSHAYELFDHKFIPDEETGDSLLDYTASLLNFNADGKMQTFDGINIGFYQSGPPNGINVDFIMRVDRELESIAFQNIEHTITGYVNGHWQEGTFEEGGIYGTRIVPTDDIDGWFYYWVKASNATLFIGIFETSPRGWFSNQHLIDFEFFRKPKSKINMTTGLQTSAKPIFWTADNVDISLDSDGTGLGWCANEAGTEVTRDLQEGHCLTYGRLYTWDDAVKVCERYDELHGADTGLMWRLPEQTDWQLLVNRAGQDAGGTAMSGDVLKAQLDSEDGLDTLGFKALLGGYVTNADDPSVATLRNEQATGYWWSGSNSSTKAYRKRISNSFDNVSSGWRSKDRLYSVRCVGEATR